MEPTTPVTHLGTAVSLILLTFLARKLISLWSLILGTFPGATSLNTPWNTVEITLPAMRSNAIGNDRTFSCPCHMPSLSQTDSESSQRSSLTTRGCTETGSLFSSQRGSTRNSTPPSSQNSVNGWLETRSETADQVIEAKLLPGTNDGGSIMGATFVGPIQVNFGTGSLPSQETSSSMV